MQILKFKSVEEVIERANDTDYGLAASIFSQDLDKAIVVSNGLRAGSVWVNTYDNFDPVAPFGGFKQSGLGREKSEYAIDSYTETKCVRISQRLINLTSTVIRFLLRLRSRFLNETRKHATRISNINHKLQQSFLLVASIFSS